MESREQGIVEEQDNIKSTEIEQTKIGLVRTLVERQDPSSKEVDDPTIRRFLRDRDLDIESASSMLLKFLKWRKTFVPNGSISPEEVPNQIAQNKMFLQGFDKKRRPITVCLGANHFQTKGGLDEYKRYIVYVFDKIIERMPPGQEKYVIIVDLEGCRYANIDIRGYIVALSILQDNYPERLGKMLIVHAPSVVVVKTMWKAVSPFMNIKFTKKIVFVETKKLKSTLLKYIDESQLPEKFGGKLPLVPASRLLQSLMYVSLQSFCPWDSVQVQRLIERESMS